MDATYNGWTNRATWNVALWAGNDEPSYRYFRDQRPREGGYDAGSAERVARDLFQDKTPDGDSLADVNWTEIAEAWNDE